MQVLTPSSNANLRLTKVNSTSKRLTQTHSTFQQFSADKPHAAKQTFGLNKGNLFVLVLAIGGGIFNG